MDAFNLSGINPIGGGGLGVPMGMPGLMGGAANRCCGSGMAMGMPSAQPLAQMVMMQEQITMLLLRLIMELLAGKGAGGGSGFGGGGGGFGGGGASAMGGGGLAASSGGGRTDTGPIHPGVDGLLQHANRMVGMHENSDTAAIQQVTGQSGINPATTPWCAAWAMNLLEDHGILKLDGLSNRNYCPTIKSWGQNKNIWGENGRYTPKPGDAILFDWNGDNNPDHIGIVERVSGGRVYTIEGNSSDSVKKNSYSLGEGRIDGYLRT